MSAPFPNDDDGNALAQLVESGSDLSKPMDVDFLIAAPDEDIAIQIANTVAVTGYRTEIFFDEDVLDIEDAAEPWTCKCSRVMTLTYEGLVDAQKKLDEIARPLGGYADGWSTWGNADLA